MLGPALAFGGLEARFLTPSLTSRLAAQRENARVVHPNPLVCCQGAHVRQMFGSELVELVWRYLREEVTPTAIPADGILPVGVRVAEVIAELLCTHLQVTEARLLQEVLTLLGGGEPLARAPRWQRHPMVWTRSVNMVLMG